MRLVNGLTLWTWFSEEVLHEVDPRSIDEGMDADGEESNEEGSVPGKRVNAETLQSTQVQQGEKKINVVGGPTYGE